jgi:hypothetical protein
MSDPDDSMPVHNQHYAYQHFILLCYEIRLHALWYNFTHSSWTNYCPHLKNMSLGLSPETSVNMYRTARRQTLGNNFYTRENNLSAFHRLLPGVRYKFPFEPCWLILEAGKETRRKYFVHPWAKMLETLCASRWNCGGSSEQFSAKLHWNVVASDILNLCAKYSQENAGFNLSLLPT